MAPTRKTSSSRAATGPSNAAARRRAELNEEIAAGDGATARVAIMDAAATIDAAFKDDKKVRETFSQHYRERASSAVAFAKETSKAFKDFRPTLFSERDSEERAYVRPGEDAAAALERVVNRGVDDLKDNDSRSLKLRLTDGVKGLVEETPGEATFGTVVLTNLIQFLNVKLPGTLALRDEECAGTLQRASAALFPDGAPQERVFAFPSFAADAGPRAFVAGILAAIRPFDPIVQDLDR